MNEFNNKTIEEKILQKIRQGGVKQKPKWQFVLHTLFLSATTLGAMLVTFYLTAYIALITKEHELLKVFSLGPKGTFMLIGAAPWLIIVLLGVIFLVLQLLVRHFSFAYRTPVLYTLGGTFALTAVLTYSLHLLDPNMRAVRFGEHGEVPLLNRMHDRYLDGKQGDVVHGVIVNIADRTYTLESRRSSSTFVFIISSSTQKLEGEDSPDIGDMVFVVTQKNINSNEAIAIQNEGDHGRRLPQPPMIQMR